MKEIMEEDRVKLPVRKDHLKRKTKRAGEVPLRQVKKRISHRKKQSGYHSNLNQLIKSRVKKVKHKSFRRGSALSQVGEKEDIDKQHLTPGLRQEKDRTDESGGDLGNAKKEILEGVGSKKRSTKEGKKKTSQKGQTSGKKATGHRTSAKKSKAGRDKRDKAGVQVKVSKTSLSPKKKRKQEQTPEKVKKSPRELNGKQKMKKKEPRKSIQRLRSSLTEKAIKVSKKSFRNKPDKGQKNQSKANPPKLGRLRKTKKSSVSNFISVKNIGKGITKNKSRRHINTGKRAEVAKDKKKAKPVKKEVETELKAKRPKSESERTAEKNDQKTQSQEIKPNAQPEEPVKPAPEPKSRYNFRKRLLFFDFFGEYDRAHRPGVGSRFRGAGLIRRKKLPGHPQRASRVHSPAGPGLRPPKARASQPRPGKDAFFGIPSIGKMPIRAQGRILRPAQRPRAAAEGPTRIDRKMLFRVFLQEIDDHQEPLPVRQAVHFQAIGGLAGAVPGQRGAQGGGDQAARFPRFLGRGDPGAELQRVQHAPERRGPAAAGKGEAGAGVFGAEAVRPVPAGFVGDQQVGRGG